MDYSKMKQNGAWKGEDIMMNLLDGSSDSDQEPLNLPPLKGKKTTKRKKTQPYNVQPNTSVCDLCSLIKIIAVVLMISLLTLLGVLTMLLYEQLGEMRKTLDSGKHSSFTL